MTDVFVIMPFGKKESIYNKKITINFDDIYNNVIKPACEELNLSVIRADEEEKGGFIHDIMYERLVYADIAIVDVTNLNPNVFYELGFRHCAKPFHTIIIYNNNYQLPFDISPLRAIPYNLNRGKLEETEKQNLKISILNRLKNALNSSTPDSPAFILIPDFKPTTIDIEKTSIYKNKELLYEDIKEQLKNVNNASEIDEIIGKAKEEKIEIIAIMLDVINAYKRIHAYGDLCDFLNNQIHTNFDQSSYLMQQYVIALNYKSTNEKNPDVSKKDRENAIGKIKEIIDKYGESSESYGILGGIYKRMMMDNAINGMQKESYLDEAINAYQKGFELNTRNYYTGVNLANLLNYHTKKCHKDDFDRTTQLKRVLPVLEYNIECLKLAESDDYWKIATVYEVKIILGKYDEAQKVLKKIMALQDDKIAEKKQSTLRNLELIKEVSKNKDWYKEFTKGLQVKEVI